MSDLISRQAVIDTIETDCSWDIFNEWGSRTPTGECIINAIKSVPSVEPEQNLQPTCNQLATDCISRQAVLDLAKSGKLVSNGSYKSVCDAINGLPSVEPERKPGKWIKVVNPDTNEWVGGFKCSECDRACVQMSMKYCANCGAKMEVDG